MRFPGPLVQEPRNWRGTRLEDLDKHRLASRRFRKLQFFPLRGPGFLSISRNFLDVRQLPDSISEGSLTGRIAVVIDVLRATTTMTAALANGATAVIPCQTVEAARAECRRHPGALSGGERGGLKIEGFDLGNCPGEYSAATVGRRTIVFTTTNGTRALAACQDARQVVLGAFVNAAAVIRHVLDFDGDATLVCAGTDGVPTLEDSLLAGCLVEGLMDASGGRRYRPAAAAHAALEMWRTARRRLREPAGLAGILATCQGGKNLVRLGLERDLELAAEVDRWSCVPCRNQGTGWIEAGRPVQPAAPVDKLPL